MVGYIMNIIDKVNSYKYSHLHNYADVRGSDSLERTLVDSDIVINLAAEHRDDVVPKSLYDG